MAELSPNALELLQTRYLLRNETGEIIETPDEMFWRVATAIASAENTSDERKQWAERFYCMMSSLEFLPNSPCLINAGKPNGMLNACFVLPIEDSLDGIFTTLRHAMLVQARGGGVGYSLSRLRPNGDMVKTTGHPTSGPISFLKVFDAAMEVVKQGGCRNGANLAALRVDHPDIEAFIACKKQEGTIKNFNLSIAVTDAFMEAVKHDHEYPLINPRTKKEVRKIRARKIWDELVKAAWGNGEPGILMIDKINRANPIEGQEIEVTNPCGESVLPPFGACNLGSLNLNAYIRETASGFEFDMGALAEATRSAVRFLDNVTTVSSYALEEIKSVTLAERRIGLGMMGLADVLLLLGHAYDSEAGRDMAEKIMECINNAAQDESKRLASRGEFPSCGISRFKNDPRRNAIVTIIAPTGSLSFLANCSSGCEPHFALAYQRNILGKTFIEVNQAFMRLAKKRNCWNETLAKQITDNKGTVRGLMSIPEDIQTMTRIASEVSGPNHVKMLAALQHHVEGNISKTINLPNSATPEDVSKILRLLYELDCRGGTVYREGSRQEEVLVRTDKAHPAQPVMTRSRVMTGNTYKVKTGHGNKFITINKDGAGAIKEIFVTSESSGSELRAWTEFASKVMSYALRLGLPIDMIIKAGKYIRGDKPIIDGGKFILSGPDALAKILEEETGSKVEVKVADGICPDCNSTLIFQDGCWVCPNCGQSRCG